MILKRYKKKPSKRIIGSALKKRFCGVKKDTVIGQNDGKDFYGKDLASLQSSSKVVQMYFFHIFTHID